MSVTYDVAGLLEAVAQIVNTTEIIHDILPKFTCQPCMADVKKAFMMIMSTQINNEPTPQIVKSLNQQKRPLHYRIVNCFVIEAL